MTDSNDPTHAADRSDPREPDAAPPEPRPLVERIGLASIAAVLAVLFGGVAVAAWAGGEPFLAVMGAIGCLMTAWVGGLTLFRG
jgi:hypothetical protein